MKPRVSDLILKCSFLSTNKPSQFFSFFVYVIIFIHQGVIFLFVRDVKITNKMSKTGECISCENQHHVEIFLPN